MLYFASFLSFVDQYQEVVINEILYDGSDSLAVGKS